VFDELLFTQNLDMYFRYCYPDVVESQSPLPLPLPSRDLYLQRASEVACQCGSSAVLGERAVSNTFTAVSISFIHISHISRQNCQPERATIYRKRGGVMVTVYN